MAIAERPKLTFGYLHDLRNPAEWGRPWDALYAETLDVIAWTEAAGFAGAWIPEHHLADDGYIPAPNLVLAAIAARTSRIRLGSAVALGPLYEPVRFAQECAVLDILAAGRLEMALAIGYRRREYAAHGVPFGTRGRRFDEFLAIVRALLAGETVTHMGDHFRVEGARLAPPALRGHPTPGGRLPLYIGGFADKALARVARFGDGYFGNEEVCPAYAAKLAEQGKDPASARIRIQALFTVVARDPSAALDELAPYYLAVTNQYAGWAAEDHALGLDGPTMRQMDLDTYKRSGVLQVLTPSQAIAHFAALRTRVPVDHVMFMRPAGLPPERFEHYAQLFADEVAPAFAD